MNNKVFKVDGILPIFTGFYSGVFDTDAMLQNAVQMYNDFNDTSYKYIDYNFENFSKDFGKIATEKIEEALTEVLKLNDKCIFSLDFKRTWSPTAYNYATDEVLIDYNFDERFITIVKNYLNANKEKFELYLKERYSDGIRGCTYWMHKESTNANFWIKELPNVQGWDDNKINLCSILDFILQNENYSAAALYYDITETGFDLYDYLDIDSDYNE